MSNLLGVLGVLVLVFALARAGELTFELPDNARECFHEVIEKGVKCALEFQVSQRIQYCRLVPRYVYLQNGQSGNQNISTG